MSVSVSKFINDEYGLDVRPGEKFQCVFCSKKTMQIKADDSLAKCFHPDCGEHITGTQFQAWYKGSLYELLDKICLDFHKALLEQELDGQSAYSYLTQERGIHETVIKDSMIGVVPDNYSVHALFQDCLESLKEKQKELQDERDVSDIEGQIKKLVEIQPTLNNIIEYNRGWLCFFYTDSQLKITKMRFRKPYTKDMVMLKISDEPGLFGVNLFCQEAEKEQTIVVEGEFDLLQLQSLRLNNARTNNNSYMKVVAIGGSNNPDFKAIKQICSRPIIIYDNDDAGISVVKKAQDFMHLDAVKAPAPFKDLDGFIRSFGSNYKQAWMSYQKMFSKKVCYYRNFESMEKEITHIRLPKGIKEFYLYNQVKEIILPDLYQRGTFYIHGHEGYYFIKEEKKLVKIYKENPELILLLSYYGINKSEQIFKFIMAEIINECYKNGIRSNVHRFAYYNSDTNVLYLSNNANLIFKISTNNIEVVDNGTDGVLFASNSNWEPYKMVRSKGSHSHVSNVIINKINFADSSMTLEEYQYLFEIWLYSLFFESIMPTKPVIAFIGVKGSGKSITMRKVGKLFFGEKFDVTPLQKDPRDFDVTASNSYFLAIDNADTKSDWLEDRIATISTGGSLKVRTLYTNNELMEIETRCFLAITSRTPYFRRDDIADRLLIIRVGHIEEYLPEQQLLNEVLKNRDEIMTEIIHRLQGILRGFEEEITDKITLRMADFASFALKVAYIDDKTEMLKSIFEKITLDQTNFTLEKNPIADLISTWLMIDDNRGRFVENKQLFYELKKIAEEHNESFLYKSHLSFAQAMTNYRSNLKNYFIIEEKSIGGNKKAYSYNFKCLENLQPKSEAEEFEELLWNIPKKYKSQF